MDDSGLTRQADTHSPTSVTPTPRLRGGWLFLARAVWLIAVVPAVVAHFVSAPFHYQDLVDLGAGDILIPPGAADLSFMQGIGVTLEAQALYHTVIHTLFPVLFIVTGILIIWSRTDDWVALVMSAGAILFGCSYINSIGSMVEAQTGWRPLFHAIDIVSLTIALLIFFIFPDGRFVPRKGWLVMVAWCIWRIIGLFVPSISFQGLPPIQQMLVGVLWFMPGVAAQVYRYRQVSSNIQQQQTKLAIYGLTLAVAIHVPYLVMLVAIQNYGVGAIPLFLFNNVWLPTVAIVVALSVSVPITFAILRHRLWDIDFVINRSLVYGILTVGLAVVFGLSLLVIDWVLRLMSLGTLPLGLNLVLPALMIALVFDPARRTLRRWIDRELYGIEIDYTHGQAAQVKRPEARHEPATSEWLSDQRYEQLELIGQGGMAKVYRAHDQQNRKLVAIKVLDAVRAARGPDFAYRFEREAKVIARLDHPNIVKLYDYQAADDGRAYMVMEYANVGSLSRYLETHEKVPFWEALSLIKAIADALDYAHQQGIVHRDIKPSNILLDSQGDTIRPILTDFGIAKVLESQTFITASGFLGTLSYIAPEQIHASEDIDGRADIYSLAVMVYEMLTGKLPFSQHNSAAVLIAHLQQPAPDPRALRPDLPRGSALAILRALAKRPEERFASAGDFVSHLISV